MSVEISKLRGQTVFSGFFMAHFACFGIVLPFLPQWMASRGLSEGEVGLILSSAFISKIVFGLGVGILADYTGHRKIWILILSILSFIGFYFLSFTDSFWPMLFVWFIVGPIQTSLIPMIDGLAISADRRGMMSNYGRARLMGSVSFIIVSFGAGLYLAEQSVEKIPMLLLAFAGIVIVSVVPLPDLRPRQKTSRKLAFLDVLKIPGVFWFIFCAAILQASHGALYAIGTLHWINSGLSESIVGLLWAEGVFAEVILFAVGIYLIKKLGLRGLLYVAVIGGVIRWILLGIYTDLQVLYVVQILHACTFAATHLSVTNYIKRYIPDELTASAQTLYDSLAMGALIGLSMTVSSWLYDMGVEGKVFWGMAVLSALAGFVLFLTRADRSKEIHPL